MKKFFYGMIVLMSVSLFFVGCETEAGEGGQPGRNAEAFLPSGTVDSADLVAAFAQHSVVNLNSATTSVSGTVPDGKTLVVVGGNTNVGMSGLEVKGAVVVRENAVLNASANGPVGGILGAAGSVSGDGVVVLPYVVGTLPSAAAGALTYNGTGGTNASTAAGKAIGSVYTSGTPGPVNAAVVATVFSAVDGPDDLTVYGFTGITNAAIPAADKTLKLRGANTATALDLSDVATGSLEVLEGGTLTITTSITGKASPGNITNNGTLVLGTSTVTGAITNNGVVTSATTASAVQAALMKLAGSGKVVLSGMGAAALDAAVALTQDIEISGTSAKVIAAAVAAPFSGSKTITIKSDGTLDLGIAHADVAFTGVTIENEGTIATTTTSVKALNAIVQLGGVITSAGAVAGNDALTVPEGTDLTHDTGTFVGGSGAVTINGTATFTTGTFATQTGAVTVNGTATFTLGTFVGLTGTANAPIFTVGEDGVATLTAATFADTTLGNIVINGTATLDTAAVPGGNVVVGGTLDIKGNGGSLVVASGKSLNLSGGEVILRGHATAPGTLTLGNTLNKNTLIKAGALTAANAVTDATLTASGAAATITIAKATEAGGADVKGASVAGNGSSTNASITTGSNASTSENATGTFASATAVAANVATVVPTAGGFGVGVTIANGVITTHASNGAYGD